MKVSEKSLELNIGAELLALMRGSWGMPKAYLRGLTQKEEKQEGVDFFARLPSSARIFAFQFKAPKGTTESIPYKYTLVREQHQPPYQLSQAAPSGVFYVFPFYVTIPKLRQANALTKWLGALRPLPTEVPYDTRTESGI